MYDERALRYLRKGPALLLAFSLVLAAIYAGLYAALPAPKSFTSSSAPAALLFPETESIPRETWSVFVRRDAAVDAAGSLSKVFRLVGTFSMGGVEDTVRVWKAVLDHLERQEQFLVREGDRVASVDVVRIHRDHVVLRSGAGEEELWLSFQSKGGEPEQRAGEALRKDLRWDEQVLETSALGKRIAENRWILSRDALLGYHQAMLDDPERLAALFLSMKPNYIDNEVAGYRVGMEGEEEFFGAVGLHNDDVVREVNSMRMTSQVRAEYFIREFAQGRLSAVVLDIERDGQPQKLVYYIR